MSASDSHRAEVRAKISRELTTWRRHDLSVPYYPLDAIMALFDSERKRWIGEVKASLPAKKDYEAIAKAIGYRASGTSIFGSAWHFNGFNEALDAVSKVLEGLK